MTFLLVLITMFAGLFLGFGSLFLLKRSFLIGGLMIFFVIGMLQGWFTSQWFYIFGISMLLGYGGPLFYFLYINKRSPMQLS